MSGEIFNDGAMLEIFRAEVETHVEVLTSGLLALERDPGETTQINSMMRGAHSIKGAARIVGIDPAVRVAHVLEDIFIAAQNGRVSLNPDHVDVLLRGVDILSRMASASKDASVNWKQFDAEAAPLIVQINAVLLGTPPVLPDAVVKRAADALESIATSNDIPVIGSRHAGLACQPQNGLVLSIKGLLDATAAETARQVLVTGLDRGIQHFQLDLSLTSDVDAIGLALLSAIPAFVQQAGRTVQLVGETADLREVLRVTGVLKLYTSGGS